MFFIPMAFILWVLLDTKSLDGGVQKVGKTFGVEAVAADPTPSVILLGVGGISDGDLQVES